jgi:hypothetical protein
MVAKVAKIGSMVAKSYFCRSLYKPSLGLQIEQAYLLGLPLASPFACFI